MRPVTLLVFALCGCGVTGSAYPPFVPGPSDLAAGRAVDAGEDRPSVREEARALLAGGEVGLADILRAVELASPEIAAARDDVLAASGRAWQAGLHPNPTFELEREGPAENGPWARSLVKFGVRQPLVLSDRRRLATVAGLAEREERALTVDEVRREVRASARTAFVELVFLRDGVRLHREMLGVAQELLEMARTRLEARVAMVPEALKPELEVLTLRSALTGLERRQAAARGHLEALLGGIPVPVERLVNRLPVLEADFPAMLRRTMEKHPRLLAARQGIEVARSRMDLARAARRPDLEARVAVGRDLEANEFTAEFSIDVPFALFDSGQGAVLEAQALLSKARRDVEAMERELAAGLSLLVGDAEAARSQIRDLRERILPLAERSLAVTREAYQAGSQEFLDVLDAQRTLLEARAAVLALERDAALAEADILAVIGDTP